MSWVFKVRMYRYVELLRLQFFYNISIKDGGKYIDWSSNCRTHYKSYIISCARESWTNTSHKLNSSLYHSLCAYYVGYNNYNVDYKLKGMAIDCIMCEPVISYIHTQFPAKSFTYFMTLVTTGYKYISFFDDVTKYGMWIEIIKRVDHSIWALGWT